MLLTAEFESRSQYPELRISFIVIPCPLWPASLWWCFISKSVIFLAFCNNIGYLHSLSKSNFSNLPPTWIISFTSKNGSKRKILLLLSSDLFKSLEVSTDFNHWSLILKLHCCAIFINIVFVPCSKLVLSRVALFTFLMMPCWLMLDNRITLNLITSATTLTILNQSDIRFSRAVKTYTGFLARHKTYSFFYTGSFSSTGGISFFVFPSCLWFPKKLWSKILPFNFITLQKSIPLDT